MRLRAPRSIPNACCRGRASRRRSRGSRPSRCAFRPATAICCGSSWLGARILREHAIPRALGPETFAAAARRGRRTSGCSPRCSHSAPSAARRGSCRSRARSRRASRSRRSSALPAAGRLARALSAAAVIVCALATIQSFGARAQVLGWPCLTSSCGCWRSTARGRGPRCRRPPRGRTCTRACSCRPRLPALFAVAALLRDGRWSRDVARRAALAAACGAATLATPLGIDLAAVRREACSRARSAARSASGARRA